MKTWDDLSNLERSTAKERAKALLVNLIIEGVVEVKMPGVIVQRNFDRILSDMRQNENPNAGMLQLFADKKIDAELNRISEAAAQGSGYDDNGIALMEEQ